VVGEAPGWLLEFMVVVVVGCREYRLTRPYAVAVVAARQEWEEPSPPEEQAKRRRSSKDRSGGDREEKETEAKFESIPNPNAAK
jgi:hypothetical protein